MEYICKICNKKYSSYQSLWIHNKKFHTVPVMDNTIKEVYNSTNIVIVCNTNELVVQKKIYVCLFCRRNFNDRSNKAKHQHICEIKINIIDENIKLKNENEKLKNNKIITINNNNNHITNNINNGKIINNITKVTLGSEDLSKLSKKDKKIILSSGYNSLITLIDLLNLNKNYPQFNNLKITNMNSKYAKTYNEELKNYETVNKKYLIEDLIGYRTANLKEIYDEYNNDTIMHSYVLKLIEKINNHPSEEYKKNMYEEITLLIYNKSNKFA